MLDTASMIFLFLVSSNFIQGQDLLNQSIEHEGRSRDYIIYLPESYDGYTPVPLLFNFHGFLGSAKEQLERGDMRPIADTANFILVYPQGSRLIGQVTHWNSGNFPNSSVDDVGFISDLIDHLLTKYNIDPNRIYACGKSNGGFFSFTLACQLSERIAAVGSVAGTMSKVTLKDCTPSHPTPVITIHSTTDPRVSYDQSRRRAHSALEVLNYWISINKTEATPHSTSIPDKVTTDNSYVEIYEYSGGEQCSTIRHYKVHDDGHDWPGISGNMDFSASEAIWNFVSQYNIHGKINCE
ncbi:MAG: PHB depolymerase family esterase [Bacteroidota bacterium]